MSGRDRAWTERISPGSRVGVVEVPVAGPVFARGALNRPRAEATRVACWASVSVPALVRGVIDFIELAWPRIRAARPDAELVVWGPSPIPPVRAAMARDPSIVHLDFVEDWMETLSGMDVHVYPVRGGAGVITKTQNALALGIPSVLSRETAASLGLAAGRDALVCQTTEEYVSACIRLLSDRSERERLGAAGRTFALESFSRDGPGVRLERALEAAVAARAPGTIR